MHIAHLVNRDICSTVRGVTERTASPYLAAALLQTRLAPLRDRICALAEHNRPVFETLAAHLATPADPDAVVAEVERIAAALLRALEDADADTDHPVGAPSPQRQLLPVQHPQPAQLAPQEGGIRPRQVAQLPRAPA